MDDVKVELAALCEQLAATRPTNIGFPAARDIDFTPPLLPMLSYLLNDVGDPWADGIFPHHVKRFEREVVNTLADMFRAPIDDRWGYVTSGASEGNEYALHLARGLCPDGIVYHSEAAHYSVEKAIERLRMESIVVRTQHESPGEIDYDDFAIQVSRHRDRPVIVVANVGSTMFEAVDDVARIDQILKDAAIRRRFIHADAALSGMPLALIEDPEHRPGFDFVDGVDSIVMSGHKFFGTPYSCGVVVVRNSQRARLSRSVSYIGSVDTTVTGSRNGHAVLALWYALRSLGVEGHRQRAEQARTVARHAHARLTQLGWEAVHHPLAFTVALRTPPPSILQRWPLAQEGGWSHVVCMPGVTEVQIDAFAADLTDVGTVVQLRGRLQLTRGERRSDGLGDGHSSGRVSLG